MHSRGVPTHPLCHTDATRSPPFQITLLIVLAAAVGRFCTELCVPPLCGALLAGILLGNVGMMDAISFEMGRVLKNFAVALIMLRAGLSLDAYKYALPVGCPPHNHVRTLSVFSRAGRITPHANTPDDTAPTPATAGG